MKVPDPPVSMKDYNDTLQQYNEAATAFDSASNIRNESYEALVSAQEAYDAADAAAQNAAQQASADLAVHIDAAKEVGVEPLRKEPKKY